MVAQPHSIGDSLTAESRWPLYDTRHDPSAAPRPISESRRPTAADLAELAAEVAAGDEHLTYPLGRRLRELVEATIEDLIGFLDSIAPDPDLEPSLGSYPYWGATEPDLEGDGADDEPGGDDEPSLGSLDRMPNQERWSDGNGGSWLLDAEAEHDGREDDELEDDGFDESREVAA